MVFLANGRSSEQSFVSGLGHGLDEAATRAAQQIKFKPASAKSASDFRLRRIEFPFGY